LYIRLLAVHTYFNDDYGADDNDNNDNSDDDSVYEKFNMICIK